MGDLSNTVYFDRKMELAVIAQCMIDYNGLNTVMIKLRETSFESKEGQIVFSVIRDMYDQQRAIDLLTLTSELMKLEDPKERQDCIVFLQDSTNIVASTVHIEQHSVILRELEVKRTLKALGELLLIQADNTSISGEFILDDLQSRLAKLSIKSAGNVQSIGELAAQKLKIINGEAEELDKYLTHIEEIDSFTQGFRAKDLVVIAARPGMGKTAWALSVAKNKAMYSNVPTAFYSLEMSAAQLYDRLLANESQVSLTKVRNKELIESDEYAKQAIQEASERLSSIPLTIDDQVGSSLNNLVADIRERHYKQGVKCVVIDYLQLMGDERKNGNREQEISRISRKLKAVAKELGILIYALSQFSRKTESRGGSRKPQLADLRESGSIEQDADVVCGLWRPWYYGIEEDDQGNSTINDAELIFLKFRNGSLGTVNLKFFGKYQQYCGESAPNLVSSELFEEIAQKAKGDDLPF